MTKYSPANDYLRKINEAEEASIRRNNDLLKEISNVIKKADSYNKKTEHLLKLRSEYVKHMQDLYPEWSSKVFKKQQEQTKNGNKKIKKETTSLFSEDLPNRKYDSLYPEVVGHRKIDYLYPEVAPQNMNDSLYPEVLSQRKNESLYPEFVRHRMQEWKNDPSFTPSALKHHTSNKFKSRLTNLNNKYTTTRDDTTKGIHFSNDSYQREQTGFDENRSYLTFQKHSSSLHSQIKVKKEEAFPYYSTPNKMDYEWNKTFPDSLKFSLQAQRQTSVLAETQILGPSPRQAHLPTENQMFSSYQSKNYMPAESQIHIQNESPTYMPIENEIKILPQLVGIAPDGRLVLLPMSSPPLNSTYSNKSNYEISTNSSKLQYFEDVSNEKAKFEHSTKVEFNKEHLEIIDSHSPNYGKSDSNGRRKNDFIGGEKNLITNDKQSIVYEPNQAIQLKNKVLSFNDKNNVILLTTGSVSKDPSSSDESLSDNHGSPKNYSVSGNHGSTDKHGLPGNHSLSGNHDSPEKHGSSENHSVSGFHGNTNLSNEFQTKEEFLLVESNINQSPQASNDHTINQYTTCHVELDKNTENHLDLKNIANKFVYENEKQSKSKNSINEATNKATNEATNTFSKPEVTDVQKGKTNKSEVLKSLVKDGNQHKKHSSDFTQPQNDLNNFVVITLLELLIEQVESNTESVTLTLNEEFSLANLIISSLDDETSTEKFNVSEKFMALRYCIKMLLQNEKVPFFIDSIDKEINFEGDLRDCINELFFEIWDQLFTFMVIFVSKFPNQLEQLAKIIAHLLLPIEHEEEKLKDVLVIILSDSMESEEFNEESINESYGLPVNTSVDKFIKNNNLPKFSSVNRSDSLNIEDNKLYIKEDVNGFNKELIKDSITEDKATNNNKKELNGNVIIEDKEKGNIIQEENAKREKENIEEKVNKKNIMGDVEDTKIKKELSLPPIDKESLIDLKYNLSLSESDSESSVSFDSDGMPVVKTPTMESNCTKTPASSEFSPHLSKNHEDNVDISSNEKSHEKKSISTHKDEDSTDRDSDDDIDILMNESLNISKRTSNTPKELTPKQTSKMIDWNDTSLTPAPMTPAESKIPEKLTLKKPGFWDESESDSDVVTPPILSSKRNDDEDDFDFDFYE